MQYFNCQDALKDSSDFNWRRTINDRCSTVTKRFTLWFRGDIFDFKMFWITCTMAEPIAEIFGTSLLSSLFLQFKVKIPQITMDKMFNVRYKRFNGTDHQVEFFNKAIEFFRKCIHHSYQWFQIISWFANRSFQSHHKPTVGNLIFYSFSTRYQGNSQTLKSNSCVRCI